MSSTPKPPITMGNESLHKSITDICRYLEETTGKSIAHPGMTEEQMLALTSQDDAGKTVINETKGKLYKSSINVTASKTSPDYRKITWSEVG